MGVCVAAPLVFAANRCVASTPEAGREIPKLFLKLLETCRSWAGLPLTPRFLSLLSKCLWVDSPPAKRERAIRKSSHFPFSPLSLLVDYGRTQQCPR